MKNKMKLKKIGVMLLAAFMMLSTFVACSAEISEAGLAPASVSFAPAVYKSINQEGSLVDMNAQVGNYNWRYKVASTEAELNAITNYSFFKGQEPKDTGLGTIEDLIKNKSYIFEIAAFTTSTDDKAKAANHEPVWKGTSALTKIKSSNTLVTINVSPVGNGNVLFDISASTASKNYDAVTGALKDGTKGDIFEITYVDISKESDASKKVVTTVSDLTYSTETNLVNYKSSLPISLATGSYLFTIQQQIEKNGKYIDVDQRGQVLIVNVQAGVNTLIKGTLDSSYLESIMYEAGADGSDQGMEITFLEGDLSAVKKLEVTVTNKDNQAKIINDNDTVSVKAGDFVKIAVKTPVSDVKDPLKVYVNKRATTSTNAQKGYAVFEGTTTATNIKYCDGYVEAYGEEDNNYIVTVRYNYQTVSFTIETISEDSAVKATVSATGSALSDTTGTQSLTKQGSEGMQVSASIGNEAAKGILDSLLPATYSSVADSQKKLTLSVGVLETDRTETSLGFDISLSALAEVFTGNEVTYSSSTDVKSVTDFVEAKVNVGAGLDNIAVKHNSNAMTSVTDKNDIPNDNQNQYGYYKYDSATGDLTLWVKSFSPFSLTFDSNIVAKVGAKQFSTLKAAIDAAMPGQTVKMEKNTVLSEAILIENEDLIIDLNGKTVSVNASKWPTSGNLKKGVLFVLAGSKLTIKDSGANGTIDSSASEYAYSAVYMTHPDNNDSSKLAKLVVESGTLKGYYAGIYTNGNVGHNNTEITINGGSMIGAAEGQDTVGIYHPCSGKLTINGGTIQGYDGLGVKGGTPVEINGGTFRATGNKKTPEKAQGSGINNVGSALYIEGNYVDGARVLVKGGTFITTDPEAAAVLVMFNTSDKASVEITGGEFSSKPDDSYIEEGYEATQAGQYWSVNAEN